MILRRRPMRRTPITPKPRRNRPDVDWPTLRQTVMDRDGVCFLFRLDDTHECRTRFGTPHSPYDTSYLTLDHVKPDPRIGVKAADVPEQMVAMCGLGNDRVPSKEVRLAQRAYLAAIYGRAVA